MKRKIVLGCIIASIICSLTGCTLKEKLSNEIQNIEEFTNTERAYIDIWKEFRTLDNEYIESGNAIQASLNDNNYDDLSKLCLMKAIYFGEDGTFKQYSHKGERTKFFYSGDFQIEQSDEISFNYQRYDKKYINSETGEEENIFIDIKKEDTNLGEGRSFIENLEDMKEANEIGYMLSLDIYFNNINRHDILPSPYNNNLIYTEYKQRFGSDLSTKLYLKNDFLVVKQKGYTFDGNVNKKEFTLKYNDTELGSLGYVEFNKDGTWKSDFSGTWTGYNGTWKLYKNNLLIVNPPTNTDVDYNNWGNLLYLDFENEEIYVPAFIRCDDILSIINNLKDSSEEIHQEIKTDITEENNNNHFNISDYEGVFYPTSYDDYPTAITINVQSETSVNILVEITNKNYTRYSKSEFSGNISDNPVTFEEKDSFNNDCQFTLEFKDGKVYLTTKHIQLDSNAGWAIPEINYIELQR